MMMMMMMMMMGHDAMRDLHPTKKKGVACAVPQEK